MKMREDKRDGMTVKYDGIEVELVMSANSLRVIEENNIVKSNVYAAIVSSLDFVLDYKNNTEFAVIDETLDMMVVAAVHTGGKNIFIDIITVIDNDKVFVRNGLSIVRINEKTKFERGVVQ